MQTLGRKSKIQQARQALFGHQKGMPGERWWARPLVGRDMLHWYMPSKFGLPEFQLEQYYEMQAERFKKRDQPEWVVRFQQIKNRIHLNREKIESAISSCDGAVDEDKVRDLKAVMQIMDLEGERELFLNKALDAKNAVSAPIVATAESLDKSALFAPRRHRFVDPLFRRRRLKWMERFLAGMNNPKEIKYNRHFTRHPDDQPKWPSNLGSVTVRWPNRRN